MEEAKAMSHQQQQQLQQQQLLQQQQQQQQQHQQQQQQQQLLQQQQQQQQQQQHQHQHQQQQQQQQQHQHQQQQHQHQQFMLLQQQLQKQQQLQSSAISRFPSNIDAHLRPLRPPSISATSPNPNPNPNPNPQNQNQNQQNQKAIRASNHLEVQMAYQDAWRVSHPDFKRPFVSLVDACERLLPYHVVADYEAEEDDRILDSDTTGLMPSRSQQWDHNIAAKVAEFTATFEKQALAFNIISRKRALGEFRSEERLMIEQALCQEEKRAYLELKTELESREKAKMRMAAFAQTEHARVESQVHAGPIRANALSAQGGDISNMGEQEHGNDADEMMMNGWGNNGQKDEKEPSEDFLNDEETENGETSWRETGEFDLNSS